MNGKKYSVYILILITVKKKRSKIAKEIKKAYQHRVTYDPCLLNILCYSQNSWCYG